MLLFLSWFLTCNGTKWPKLCLCAVKKLLTHSLTRGMTSQWNLLRLSCCMAQRHNTAFCVQTEQYSAFKEQTISCHCKQNCFRQRKCGKPLWCCRRTLESLIITATLLSVTFNAAFTAKLRSCTAHDCRSKSSRSAATSFGSMSETEDWTC